MFNAFEIENEACLCQEWRPQGIVENGKTAPRDQSRMQLVACSQGHPEHTRNGALADIVEKHEVVLEVASQASHLSVFLLPSQAFETC